MLACAVAGDGDRWPDGEAGLRLTGKAAPVVLATFEDDADELERRRRRLVSRGYAPADRDRLDGRAHVVDLSERGPLWTVDRYGPLDSADASGLDALAAYADDVGARLVVIDPLYAAFGGSENDRAHAGAFLTRLRRVAADLKAAVLLVSHPPKGTAGTSRAAAGADPSGVSTWRDGVRAVWRLGPMPDGDATGTADKGADGKLTKHDALTLDKSNYGLAHPRLDPVYVCGDDFPRFEASTPNAGDGASSMAYDPSEYE